MPSGSPVEIVAHTDFTSDVSEFDATLDGCESGTVVNGENATAHFTPWGGVFNGDKEFTCAGGLSGFTLRLKARFGEDGSTGSWTVASGWGALDGLKGSGTLAGHRGQRGHPRRHLHRLGPVGGVPAPGPAQPKGSGSGARLTAWARAAVSRRRWCWRHSTS